MISLKIWFTVLHSQRHSYYLIKLSYGRWSGSHLSKTIPSNTTQCYALGFLCPLPSCTNHGETEVPFFWRARENSRSWIQTVFEKQHGTPAWVDIKKNKEKEASTTRRESRESLAKTALSYANTVPRFQMTALLSYTPAFECSMSRKSFKQKQLYKQNFPYRHKLQTQFTCMGAWLNYFHFF